MATATEKRAAGGVNGSSRCFWNVFPWFCFPCCSAAFSTTRRRAANRREKLICFFSLSLRRLSNFGCAECGKWQCVCCVAPCCLWKRVTRTVCSEKIYYIEYPCKIVKNYTSTTPNFRFSIKKRRQGRAHFKTSLLFPPFFNQSPSPSSSFVLTALSLFSSTQWRKAPIQQSLINNPRRDRGVTNSRPPPPFSTIFLFREKSVPFPRKK